MAWLSSLLKKADAEENVALLEPELTPEPPALVPTGPQLAILVPDMAGISSFRFSARPDAASAGEFIAAQRAEVRHETHAFWALHDKPIVDESTHVEALVLIRAQAGSDLVYVVSFLDLESALSFTRFEVRRGLYLGNVMIYWAAFTQLREELDGISVQPAFAPPTENYVPPVIHEQLHVEPIASVAVAEPVVEPEPIVEPEVETPVESEARQAVEEYLRKQAARSKPAPRIEPVVEQAAPVEPAVIEKPPVIEQPPVIEPPVTVEASAATQPAIEDDEDLGPLWPEAQPATPTAAESDLEISSPVAEEQAAINEAFVFQHKTVEFRSSPKHRALEAVGEANGLLVDHEPEPIATFSTDPQVAEKLAARLGIGEPEPSIETIPGDEEMDEAQFVPLGGADPAAGLTTSPKLDDFDVAYEVERLLRGRKWEQRDGPFSGFQSPPGRF
jgi:hypothetical protein